MSTPSQQELVDIIVDMQRQIDELKRSTRTAQLPDSSLRSGQAIRFVGEDEEVVGSIGQQADGGWGLVVTSSDPPPPPSTPTVEPSYDGIIVTWDATLADPDADLPTDLDHVDVHVDLVPDGELDGATRAGTIPRAGGQCPVGPLETGVVHWVRLVAVSSAAVEGEPSEAVSVVPLKVVEGVGPGQITETLIADDSISTPKLRAGSVETDKLAANAVTAGKIAAGSVTADKLTAILALVTRIVAGIPGAARVELDSAGLRGYSTDNEVIFVIDSAGHAVFSGDITGATISGGSLTAQATDDAESRIELLAGAVENFIALWPPTHPTITWRSAALQCIHYGSRGRFRITSPGEQGQAYAEIEMAGWTPASPWTIIDHYADYTRFFADPGTFGPGVVSFDNSVSLKADFHAPKSQDMLANPTFTTTGSFVDFAPAQFPPISFTTGESGRVDVTVAMAGMNHATAGSSIALGFRLSGGSTVAAALKRCAYSRSIGAGVTYVVPIELTVPLQLAPNANYTLTPTYRISSGSSSTASFDLALPNSLSVRNTL